MVALAELTSSELKVKMASLKESGPVDQRVYHGWFPFYLRWRKLLLFRAKDTTRA